MTLKVGSFKYYQTVCELSRSDWNEGMEGICQYAYWPINKTQSGIKLNYFIDRITSLTCSACDPNGSSKLLRWFLEFLLLMLHWCIGAPLHIFFSINTFFVKFKKVILWHQTVKPFLDLCGIENDSYLDLCRGMNRSLQTSAWWVRNPSPAERRRRADFQWWPLPPSTSGGQMPWLEWVPWL